MFYSFDTAVYAAFGHIQTNWMNVVAQAFTFLGSGYVIVGLLVLSIAALFFKKTRKYGFALIAAVALELLVVNVIMKPAFARPRPYVGLEGSSFWHLYQAMHAFAGNVTASDYSFPSGHTATAFSIFLSLALTQRTDGKKWIWWFLPVPFLVGASRIYLCVHYPSDVVCGVLVGILVGLAAFGLTYAAMAIIRKRNGEEKAAMPEKRRRFRGSMFSSTTRKSDLESFKVGANIKLDYSVMDKYKNKTNYKR